MGTKLFVGNLDFKVTENDLQAAFAAVGTVGEANLVTDRTTGRPRGFAFVTMNSPEEAQKAIDGMNGKDLSGRALNVNAARPREERSGGAMLVRSMVPLGEYEPSLAQLFRSAVEAQASRTFLAERD